MVLLLCSKTRICFKLIVFSLLAIESIFAFPSYEIEENNTSSYTENEDSYIDDIMDEDKLKFCSEADLKTVAYADVKLNKVIVSFELADKEHNHCFTYFDIVLRRNKKAVDTAKIPFNYKINEVGTWTFENITCGSYEVLIHPCYNDWQCSLFRFRHPDFINMSGINCIENLPPTPAQIYYKENYHMKVISLLTGTAILLMMSIGGFAYCYYNSICIKENDEEMKSTEKENKLLIKNALEKKENIGKRIKVYILHYSNKVILKNVLILKDFLSKLPNIEVVLIQDELHKILFDRTFWINEVLQADEDQKKCGKYVMKKIIIVDADIKQKGNCHTVEMTNENENEVFEEARTKLGQDWLRSLNDYNRIFVIRFNGLSEIKSQALTYVVPGVRYDILDNQLISLCQNLLSGSGFESSLRQEDLIRLMNGHEIMNISSTEA